MADKATDEKSTPDGDDKKTPPSAEEAKAIIEKSKKQVSSAPNEDSDALEKGGAQQPIVDQKDESEKKGNFLKEFFLNLNPYMALFIVIIAVGIIVVFVANDVNRQEDAATLKVEDKDLDQSEIDQLIASESNIGTVDQTLTVGANAIFNGKILVKDSLDVAGSITIGGELTLPGINVAGQSNFETVDISNNLSILGSASIQDSLTVQANLNVAGGATIDGTLSASRITAQSLEITSNLSLTQHVDTGGGLPTITRGTAAGSGGTVSISGNDIAGTITINTGGSPPAGILAKITFRNNYNIAPYVQATPASSAAGGLNWYVSRDTSSFSVGTSSAPSAASTYRFDYFIVE